ncbi:MAG: sugar ABC transporter substrate-binding protein [Sphaerochaetaceae bacterium]|nr:sugar ABC transporter substrate-binding protein [Sphaerochaetaceae bacterium]
MKKIMTLLLVSLLCLSAGFAQGGKEGGKEQVILKYWASPLSNTEYTLSTWNQVIEGFTAETGIKIEVEVIPWGDMTKKATTAITSGDGPDLMGCGNNMSVQLAPTGALLSLSPERMSKVCSWDTYYDAVIGLEGEDPVAIPLNVGSTDMVYNIELFRNIGITEMPHDWDSFIAAAQKLTRDVDGDGNIDIYGLGMFGKPTQSFKMFYNRFVQHGGQLLDEDGIPGFNSKAGAATLKFIGDMIATYKITPPVCAEWTQDEMVNAFINGKLASCTVDNETITTLNKSSMSGKFGICELPYILPGEITGIRCTSHVGGSDIGIFATTKHEEECLMFLKYISRPEINRQIAEAFNIIASVKAVYEGRELDPQTAAQVEIMNNACVAMPMVPYFLPSINDASLAVQNVMFAAATGKMNDALIASELEKLDAKVRENMRLSGY